MDASAVSSERVPWKVRYLLYFGPHRIPPEWRGWAAERIRTPEASLKLVAWRTLMAGTAGGSAFFVRGMWGSAALLYVGLWLFGILTMEYQRREVLDSLATGRSHQSVRLRWWDVPLALAIVAGVAVLAMVLFTP